MVYPEHISMDDYHYELSQERIAEYPVKERDHSRLLLLKHDGISEDNFFNVDKHLPEGSLMVFNNTRVIRARLVFHKETGACIEVFCLEPVLPTHEINNTFESSSPVSWKCLIGNAKKWKSGRLSMPLSQDGRGNHLYAERAGEVDGAFLVKLSWDSSESSFAEIIEAAGKVPLPPYIEREAEEEDVNRYQTIYAAHNGSVAAPTAGLHFTEGVMHKLADRKIDFASVVLHVGAGTFKPVSHKDIRDHEMHTEQIIVSRELLQTLLNKKDRPLIAVGTTSVRTLESLYWYGVILETDPGAELSIGQWLPYRENMKDISKVAALNNILNYMDRNGVNEISGVTRVIIVPGYRFRIVDILITNFHMPKSTLLLLVAAFAGDGWKDAYDFALEKKFRFLSYGDSCLFFRRDQNL
ncbi:MAG: S-adenosylmethionine:tRNA ribosyltransferase-isomerase [Bacteroidetes bacterium]|nr:S-adenosylmethionine:tRNA ribosyltransferase-isomerase [Bacteroidota bacterium]